MALSALEEEVVSAFDLDTEAKGLTITRITESPRKNILGIIRSFGTALTLVPVEPLGTSIHISLTPSSTILQWRSKAFTLANNFLLLRTLINT